MKKFVILFVVILNGLFFTNCEKEEFKVPVDMDAIRTQMKNQSLPSDSEISMANSTVKSATATFSVKYFAMADYTWRITETEAVKLILGLEKDNSNYLSRILTIEQTFPIVDGQILTDGYNLDVHFGYKFSKIFRIKSEVNANYIWHWVHLILPDGEEYSYFDPNDEFYENNTLELAPIEDAIYQIRVGTNVHYGLGKDKYEILSTYPFFEKTFENNRYDDTEIEIEINFDLKEESPYYLEVSRNHDLWDTKNGWLETINVFGNDGEGSFRLEVLDNPTYGNAENRIFSVPFWPTQIMVGYREESFYNSGGHLRNYNIKFDRTENGKLYFRLE